MDLTSTLAAIGIWGIIVIHEINGCNGQDLIGPTPPTQAVVMGNTHTLSCSRGSGVTDDVTWLEDVQGGARVTISLGSDIRNSDPKYSNFAIDTNNDNGVDFNLVISDAAVEDEGVYQCQLFATSITETVTLTVEVRASSMEIKQDDIAVTEVTLTENISSNITCTALGARPVVQIWWYHQQIGGSETRIMTGVTQTETSNGDTFDTISTLQYTASRVYNDGIIRCETNGQEVAESRSVTASIDVQYPPDVSVQYGGDKATCSSVANPDVPMKEYGADMEGYIFIVNNTDEYAPTECSDGQCTLNLEVKFNTDVRCNAANSIGTGFDTTVAVPGAVITTTPEPITPGRGTTIGGEVIHNDTIYVAFLVILSLLLVASLVFNIVVGIRYNRLLKSGKMSNSQTQMESRTPNPTNLTAGGDQYQELNTKSREKEHAYQQPDSSGLPQRVENEQGPTYEDLNNSSNDNQPTYEVAGDEVKAGGNQQSPMYVNARPTRPRHGKHDK